MCLPKGSLSDHRYRIKVEQSVTQPPPHRSRRAVLPHREVKHFLHKRPPICCLTGAWVRVSNEHWRNGQILILPIIEKVVYLP